MSTRFNCLKSAEDERLSLLLEELGEAIQAIGKIKRHGYESWHPDMQPEFNNRFDLEKEIGHVQYVVDLMIRCGDLSVDIINMAKSEKADSVQDYLHYPHKPRKYVSDAERIL